jgi:sortase (surface protein transpeptidase)
MLTADRRPIVRPRRLLAVVSAALVVATLLAAAASPASAASIRRTWHATLGAPGAGGTATLTAYWTGNADLALDLAGLKPATTYPVIVYRGTCSAPTVVATLPAAVTDASGAIATAAPVSITTMNSVWAVARTNPVAIKIGTGTLGLCGALRFPVASRIAIPTLKIDLPVIRQAAGYPLCNVAMYIKELSQPGEAGVSLIYAHARKGMFLPLLDRSKINDGASLIGMTVKVWTNNDLLSTYRITKVRRHVTSLSGVFGIESEQLWIQTSEGPRGTVAKLIVVAKRIGTEPATHEAANPVPKPVVCG